MGWNGAGWGGGGGGAMVGLDLEGIMTTNFLSTTMQFQH